MEPDNAKEYAPLVPMGAHASFLWSRYGFANEQICHGNAEEAIDTFYDLLLEPDLPIYLRSMVNASLALTGNHRTLAERTKWLNEAKRTYELVKLYKETVRSEEANAFLEDTIRDAEKELEGVQATIDAQDDDDDDEEDEDDDEDEDVEAGERGEDEDVEAENPSATVQTDQRH